MTWHGPCSTLGVPGMGLGQGNGPVTGWKGVQPMVRKTKGSALVYTTHSRYIRTKVCRTDRYVPRKQRRALYAAKRNA